MGEDMTMDIAVWALWIGGGGFTLIVLACIAWGMWYDFFGRRKSVESIDQDTQDECEFYRNIRNQVLDQQARREYERLKQKALRRTLKRKRPPLHKRIRY